MKKKILSVIMVLSLGVSLINPIYASAEERISQEDDMITNITVSETCLEEETYSEIEYNVVERELDCNISIDENAVIDIASVEGDGDDTASDTNPNTDPNNAYIITDNTMYSGEIENENELRWYAFEDLEGSRITAYLEMDEYIDADLYLFKLNESTMTLDLVGGSASEGIGTAEYYSDVIEAGIYFIAISGYESIGEYTLYFFMSNLDASYEVNDSASTATEMAFGSNVSAVIDSPLDVDFYKITLSQPAIIKYGITTTDGYTLAYMGSATSSGHLYNVDTTRGYIKALADTYYFAVYSTNSTYSSTSPYTVSFKKIGNMTTNSSAYLAGISETAGIVYETNADATVNYVNGNLIDISYSYVKNLSNSAGGQYYNITINPDAGEFVVFDSVCEPAAVHYFGSTKPAMNVSSRPALMLTYYGNNVFYRINCWGTGAYSMNTYRDDFNIVTVLIDPETGKLIDIVEFNYYYDFAPVGTNYITWTRSYTMTLY